MTPTRRVVGYKMPSEFIKEATKAEDAAILAAHARGELQAIGE